MIGFLGDIHGDVQTLCRIVDEITEHNKTAIEFDQSDKVIEVLIQVGDWGIRRQYMNEIKPPFPIYWIDGNHEYYDQIREYPDSDVVEVANNVFYVRRGTVLTLDGRRVAFMGGAGSVDKAWRKPEKDWFVDENITDDQIARLDGAEDIDILVTHVPPQSVIAKNFDPLNLLMFGLPVTWVDENAVKIENLWAQLRYPQILSGRMHATKVGEKYRILNIDELFAY